MRAAGAVTAADGGLPPSGGTVSLVQSADATITVANGGGPTVDLSSAYGPPLEYASTLVELPTATPPGAGPPTIPPYPGSLIWFSLGTSGAPKVIPRFGLRSPQGTRATGSMYS